MRGGGEEQEDSALTKVAQRPAVARLAFADIGRDASAVAAVLRADGDATVAVCGFRVALAALLHGLLFRQFLRKAQQDGIIENCMPFIRQVSTACSPGLPERKILSFTLQSKRFYSRLLQIPSVRADQLGSNFRGRISSISSE